MTLDELRASSTRSSFPHEAVAGLKTGICFFCAGFHGKNDVLHLFDAGLTVTGVDIDWPKLQEMRALYGPGFTPRHGDAFLEAKFLAERPERWDVVVCDPWSQHQPEVLRQLDVFAPLATKVLIVGASTTWLAEDAVLKFPAPWALVERRKRSEHLGGQEWLVFTRSDA